MAKQRLQVDSGLRPAESRPVAAPVSTFVQPEQESLAGQKLAQLGQALVKVSPSIAQFTGTLIDQHNEDQQAAGIAAARRLREEGLTLAEATRKGLIPKSSNQFFMAGFREQMGRVMADKWESSLKSAMIQDDKLRESTNPNDFESFVQKHRQEWLSDNVGETERDRFFESGFGNRADAYEQNAQRQFLAQVENNIGRVAGASQFEEVHKAVRLGLDNKIPMETVAADLNTLVEDMVRHGRSPQETLQATAQAIATAALDARSLDALKLFDLVKSRQGVLRDSKWGAELVTKVRDSINDQKWQDNQRAHAEQETERTDRTRTVMSDVMKTLQTDPHADLKPFIAKVMDIPEAVDNLTGLSHNVVALSSVRTDESVKRDLFGRIFAVHSGSGYVTTQTVMKQFTSGNLSVADADYLIDQITQRDRAGKGSKDKDADVLRLAQNDFDFRQALSALDQQFDKPLTGMISGERGERVRFVEAKLTSEWYDLWSSGKGQTMSPGERLKWLTERSTELAHSNAGKFHVKLDPAATPDLAPGDVERVKASLPKTLLLDEADLLAALNGHETARMKTYKKQYGLTRFSLPLFLSTQRELLHAQLTKKQTP